nr:hypothetical protein [Tanacetum cinerariifolium]
MRRVGKGFFEVETPLFEGMLVAQEVGEGVADEVHEEGVHAAGIATEGDVSAAHDEVLTVAEEPSIPSPTPPTPPQQPSQDIPSTSQVQPTPPQSPQGRMIAEMDQDADVVLKDDKEVVNDVKDVQDDIDESAQDQGRKAEIYKIDLVTTAPSRIRKGVVIRDPQEESTTFIIIPAETKSKDKGKGILVEEPKPLKKQAQIEQDEQYARDLEAELNGTIDWDEVIDYFKMKAKEDHAVKRYQALKRKPQTEAQDRKNMMIYLKNVAGFKMDYFKGMSYDDIRPIFERYFYSNRRMIAKMDQDVDLVLEEAKEVAEDAKVDESVDIQGRKAES